MVASTSPQGDKSPPQSPKQTASTVKKPSGVGITKARTPDTSSISTTTRSATTGAAQQEVRPTKTVPPHPPASKSSASTTARKSANTTTTAHAAPSVRAGGSSGTSTGGHKSSVSTPTGRSTTKSALDAKVDANRNATTRAQSVASKNAARQNNAVKTDRPANDTAGFRVARSSRATIANRGDRSNQSSVGGQDKKTKPHSGTSSDGNRRQHNANQTSLHGRGIRIGKSTVTKHAIDKGTAGGTRTRSSSSTTHRSDILSKKRDTIAGGNASAKSHPNKNQHNRTYSAGGVSGKGNFRTGGNEGGELKFKQDNRFRRRGDGDSSNFSRSNRSEQYAKPGGARFGGGGNNRRGTGKPPFEKNSNFSGNRNRNNGPAGTLLKKGAVSSRFGGRKTDDIKGNRPWNRFDTDRASDNRGGNFRGRDNRFDTDRASDNRGGNFRGRDNRFDTDRASDNRDSNFRGRDNRWGDFRGDRGNSFSSDQHKGDRFAGRGSSFRNTTPSMQGDVPFSEQRQSQNDWYKNKEQRAKHDRDRYDANNRDKEIEMQLSPTSSKSIPLANPIPKSISITEAISVSDLAKKLNIKGVDLVSKLVSLGIMASINNVLDSDTATLIAEEYGAKVNIISLYDETKLVQSVSEDCKPQRRPPVVTVMGHVDHGKTTLLDTIRKTDVVAGESGGITQHIAAYQIESKGEKITFIDTPGHAAFTMMRARGAQITDIVVLVVSADDGIMPQTKEAIDHARAAKVPIIVAINKIDLEGSNIEQTKKQLSEVGLVAEEWGGEVIMCPVSALKGDGVSELLEAILVASHEMDCVALVDKSATGRILESRIDQGRGIVCSVLLLEGTLRNGDFFLAGTNTGKVRSIYDDRGNKLSAAYPSAPVEIIGFSDIPNAGDPFEVAADEREAKSISSKRKELSKVELAREMKPLDVEGVYHTIEQQHYKVSKVIVKGDVDGSVEAIKASLSNLQNDQVRLEVIHTAAGDVNENDVLLARASRAMIICFNIKPSARIQKFADQEEIEIRKYNVIYNMIDDMKRYISGMRESEYKEVEIGGCEVRAIFSSSKNEHIIGAYVNKGKVKINAPVEVVRKKTSLFKSTITSLKRFKKNVSSVDTGYECGIVLDNDTAVQEGDIIKVYESVLVEQTSDNT